MEQDVLTGQTYEPRAGFRWIVQLQGIDAFKLRKVRSLPDDQLEIEIFWLRDEPWPDEPSTNFGFIKLLDDRGVVTDAFKFTFFKHQLLPFNLDYTERNTFARILFQGVSFERIPQ